MKKKQQSKYEQERIKLMEKNYDAHVNSVCKKLDKEYKRILEEINAELLKWESIRANNGRPQGFGYSEEKHLKESKRAIELLLDELANIEFELLDDMMDDLFARDLMDMKELEIKYLQYRDDNEIESMLDYYSRNPHVDMGDAFEDMLKASQGLPLTSTSVGLSAVAVRTESIMWVEQIMKQPIDASLLNKSIWYQGCEGKSFAQRIATRMAQIEKEVNQALTSMYSQGKGYEYASKRIAERLDVSNTYAKRLVQNEARATEISANVHHYSNTMGTKYFARMSVKDSRVCPICKEHENDVYTAEELKANSFKAHLHVGDRCMLIPLSSTRGEEAYNSRKNKNR
jgi:SPP1 gp7 family putative phage head morphogenesis protein